MEWFLVGFLISFVGASVSGPKKAEPAPVVVEQPAPVVPQVTAVAP